MGKKKKEYFVSKIDIRPDIVLSKESTRNDGTKKKVFFRRNLSKVHISC